MKIILFITVAAFVILSCNTNSNSGPEESVYDYAYKATYSSDITCPSHPEYAQMVLKIWKMFESNEIDSMRQYYADTVTYDPSNGHRFHGSKNDLLNYAAKDVAALDSLRFDISMWQSVHLKERNEDWVYIWATERRYGKDGTADTSLMHEQWQIVNKKVAYFNQYNATPPKQKSE